MPTIGVLALQGDARSHLAMLQRCGSQAVTVRRPEELLSVDGLIIPGGESTTILDLAVAFDVLEPLRKRVHDGMPTLGTCAGMIMLADRIEDGVEGQETLGGIDMTVRRNAFGRQVDSFEVDLPFDGLDAPYHAVFIRAPRVEAVGSACTPVARMTVSDGADTIVAVRQGRLVATSFHPELTGDTRIHDYFVRLVKEA